METLYLVLYNTVRFVKKIFKVIIREKRFVSRSFKVPYVINLVQGVLNKYKNNSISMVTVPFVRLIVGVLDFDLNWNNSFFLPIWFPGD